MADFATYGWIENNTDATIVVTGTNAVHGTWGQTPTPTKIPPGGTAQFVEKDPTGAALGSEGSVALLVADPSAATIGLQFQCGYAQDNYAKSNVNSSGFKVQVKAGSGENGQSEMNGAAWGTVPGDGHPFYSTWKISSSS